MKWFRLYHRIIDDPEICMMSDSDQLYWIKLLCLASESKIRGVITLGPDQIAWRLRATEESIKHVLDKLRAKGLIDHTKKGIKISNWDKLQFASDDPNLRSRKHRKKCNVASNNDATLQATPPDTDTDTDPYSDPDPDPDTNTDPDTEYREDKGFSDFGLTENEEEKPKKTRKRKIRVRVDKKKQVANEVKPKEISKIEFFEEFRKIFNERKPDLWAEAQKLTKRRIGYLTQFVKTHGVESALEVWEKALSAAASDEWFSKHALSFDQFCSNDKPTGLAEKFDRSQTKGMVQNADQLRRAKLYAALQED